MKYDSTQSQIGTKFILVASSYSRVDSVTFRIYAYNAEDALGTFGIDSVYIAGTNGFLENTQNFMDYSYCSKMYTYGQKGRMRATLESSISQRNNLWSAANLAATGVLTPQVCKPKPEFFVNKDRVCAGDIVKFTPNILYGTPDSVRWTFYGGTPSTSTANAAVNVTYASAGLYKAVLTAYNAGGTDSIVKTDYIRVDPSWADVAYDGSFTEDFQNTSDFYWKWQVKNYDNNPSTWYVASNAGYLSTKSVVMTAHNNYRYDVDDLVSPSYDLSFTSGNVMTFRCAAASRAGAGADVNDMLKVYISTNCGQSWALRATFKDSTLINAGYDPYYFTPTSSSQWALRSVNILSSFNTGNVRFKFEYTTGAASNNIYIDDINISGVVGIDEDFDAMSSLSIYPNPTSQSSTIAYHLDKKANTKIEVIDVLGKVSFTQSNDGQPEGDYSVIVSKENLNLRNGIYFVKFSVDGKSTTKKLIITQ
jgi:PKD repeat protein